MRTATAILLFVLTAPVVAPAQKTDVYSRPKRVERSSDYDALEGALAKWMGIQISIKRFFASRSATTGSIDDFVEVYG